MSELRMEKVVGSPPASPDITPDTIYAVRTGEGYDLMISDHTGAHIHKMNPPKPQGDVPYHHLSGFFPNGFLQNDTNPFSDKRIIIDRTKRFMGRGVFKFRASQSSSFTSVLIPSHLLKFGAKYEFGMTVKTDLVRPAFGGRSKKLNLGFSVSFREESATSQVPTVRSFVFTAQESIKQGGVMPPIRVEGARNVEEIDYWFKMYSKSSNPFDTFSIIKSLRSPPSKDGVPFIAGSPVVIPPIVRVCGNDRSKMAWENHGDYGILSGFTPLISPIAEGEVLAISPTIGAKNRYLHEDPNHHSGGGEPQIHLEKYHTPQILRSEFVLPKGTLGYLDYLVLGFVLNYSGSGNIPDIDVYFGDIYFREIIS